MLGWNPWHVMVCRPSFSSSWTRSVGHLCCRGRMGASRGPARCGQQRLYSMAMLSWSARSLVNVHSALGVLPPGHTSWVVWGYCVKRGGEPYLLVRGDGGAGGVVVGGDEVQGGPWGVEGRQTAVPARVWCALVIMPDRWHIGFRGVVFWDGPGFVVSLDGAVCLLLPVGG